MAANQGDFLGSLAQDYLSFATSFSVVPNPGQNFENVLLFVGSGEAVASSGTLGTYFLPSSGLAPAVGTLYTANQTTYTQQFNGPLLAWATEFFASGSTISNLYVAIYDDSSTAGGTTFPAAAVTALTTQYTAYNMYAYFKLISNITNVAAQLALAKLCQADNTLISQCWIPSNDVNLLTAGGSTIQAQAKAANYDPVIIYDANTVAVGTGTVIVNGALIQLGLSLASVNGSGMAVGNALDMLATTLIGPSGAGNTSLTFAQMTTLTGIYVGFFMYVGNTTGQVALRNARTVLNNLPPAQWVTCYVDYMTAVMTATYLTQGNRFKTNATYQAILAGLMNFLSIFANTGRLSNLLLTAPPFSQIQTTSNGQTITVPNAWQATFNDSVRNVTVNGTLYISAS